MNPGATRIADHLQALWWTPKRRPGATFLFLLGLLPLSAFYRAMWACRSLGLRIGALRSQRAPVPVVVVGNWVVGGAGKTPCTMALVRALQARGFHPGIVSRGYGGSAVGVRAVQPLDDRTCGQAGEADEVGDEPLLMAKRLGVPVWVGAKRAQAALALCEAHREVDVLVSDDGLQHAALHRDAQLIVFDDRGVGNGHVIPAGPLRQPWSIHPPARSIVIYTGSRVSTPWPGHWVPRHLGAVVRWHDWSAGHLAKGQDLWSWQSEHVPAHQSVAAVAGIASPEQFFAMLRATGLSLVAHPRPDHASADSMAWPEGTGPILITEKDAIKVSLSDPVTARLWVVTLDFELPQDVVSSVISLLGTPVSSSAQPSSPL